MIGGPLDPAVHLTLRLFLALLLLASSAHKIRRAPWFRSTLAEYGLLPQASVGVAAIVVTAAELLIAIALLVPQSAAAPPLGACILFAIYTVAIGVNLLRGRRDIDCGCSGVLEGRRLGEGLVLRNLGLMAVAAAAALPPAARPLVWIDATTIVASVATLGLLYASIDMVVANAGPLRSIARRRAALVSPGRSSHQTGTHLWTRL